MKANSQNPRNIGPTKYKRFTVAADGTFQSTHFGADKLMIV